MSPRRSLTGDPDTDRLVPAATRLVSAVRTYDRKEVAAAFEDAAAAAPPGADPAAALAVVLAAMVPWHDSAGPLLAWCARATEFDRLLSLGVDRATAASLIERPPGEGR